MTVEASITESLRSAFRRGSTRVVIVDAVDVYTNPSNGYVLFQGESKINQTRLLEKYLPLIQHFVDAARPKKITPVWIAHKFRNENPFLSGKMIHKLNASEALKTFHIVKPQEQDLKIAKRHTALSKTPNWKSN